MNKRRVLQFDPRSKSSTHFPLRKLNSEVFILTYWSRALKCYINDENLPTDAQDMKKVLCFGKIWSEMTLI